MSDGVCLGWVHTGIVQEAFARSIAETCLRPENEIVAMSTAQSPRQEAGRNEAIKGFLGTDAEWLMWIDTDMVFEKHSVRDLLHTARDQGGDIVAGLGFAYNHQTAQLVPNGFRWEEEGTYFKPVMYEDYPERVLSVDGVGSGFMLVNRSVYEAWDGEVWHETLNRHPASGTLMGHDLNFCYKAKFGLGVEILWDTYVKTGHIKSFALTEDNYNAYRRS